MKDKMFGRPIVELPPIHPVKLDSQPALEPFITANIVRTHNTSHFPGKREYYTASSKTGSGTTLINTMRRVLQKEITQCGWCRFFDLGSVLPVSFWPSFDLCLRLTVN